jgi:hypothetical protein
MHTAAALFAFELSMQLAFTTAGLPANSDRIYCTSNVSASCYFYDPYYKNYTTARTKCSSGLPWHGWLVSYNSSEEQLDVERVGGS